MKTIKTVTSTSSLPPSYNEEIKNIWILASMHKIGEGRIGGGYTLLSLAASCKWEVN